MLRLWARAFDRKVEESSMTMEEIELMGRLAQNSQSLFLWSLSWQLDLHREMLSGGKRAVTGSGEQDFMKRV